MAVALAIFPETATVLFSGGDLRKPVGWLDHEGDECEAEEATYVVVLNGRDALALELDDFELRYLN